MDKYQRELQELKSWDEVQGIEIAPSGYSFIYTAGHGYLVVPQDDKRAELARKICKYGFIGELAIYLEEDCEAGKFEGLLK